MKKTFIAVFTAIIAGMLIFCMGVSAQGTAQVYEDNGTNVVYVMKAPSDGDNSVLVGEETRYAYTSLSEARKAVLNGGTVNVIGKVYSAAHDYDELWKSTTGTTTIKGYTEDAELVISNTVFIYGDTNFYDLAISSDNGTAKELYFAKQNLTASFGTAASPISAGTEDGTAAIQLSGGTNASIYGGKYTKIYTSGTAGTVLINGNTDDTVSLNAEYLILSQSGGTAEIITQATADLAPQVKAIPENSVAVPYLNGTEIKAGNGEYIFTASEGKNEITYAVGGTATVYNDSGVNTVYVMTAPENGDNSVIVNGERRFAYTSLKEARLAVLDGGIIYIVGKVYNTEKHDYAAIWDTTSGAVNFRGYGEGAELVFTVGMQLFSDTTFENLAISSNNGSNWQGIVPAKEGMSLVMGSKDNPIGAGTEANTVCIDTVKNVKEISVYGGRFTRINTIVGSNTAELVKVCGAEAYVQVTATTALVNGSNNVSETTAKYLITSTPDGTAEIITGATDTAAPVIKVTPGNSIYTPYLNGTALTKASGEYTFTAAEGTNAITYVIEEDGKKVVYVSSTGKVDVNGEEIQAYTTLTDARNAIHDDGGIIYIVGKFINNESQWNYQPATSSGDVIFRGYTDDSEIIFTQGFVLYGNTTFEGLGLSSDKNAWQGLGLNGLADADFIIGTKDSPVWLGTGGNTICLDNAMDGAVVKINGGSFTRVMTLTDNTAELVEINNASIAVQTAATTVLVNGNNDVSAVNAKYLITSADGGKAEIITEATDTTAPVIKVTPGSSLYTPYLNGTALTKTNGEYTFTAAEGANAITYVIEEDGKKVVFVSSTGKVNVDGEEITAYTSLKEARLAVLDGGIINIVGKVYNTEKHDYAAIWDTTSGAVTFRGYGADAELVFTVGMQLFGDTSFENLAISSNNGKNWQGIVPAKEGISLVMGSKENPIRVGTEANTVCIDTAANVNEIIVYGGKFTRINTIVGSNTASLIKVYGADAGVQATATTVLINGSNDVSETTAKYLITNAVSGFTAEIAEAATDTAAPVIKVSVPEGKTPDVNGEEITAENGVYLFTASEGTNVITETAEKFTVTIGGASAKYPLNTSINLPTACSDTENADYLTFVWYDETNGKEYQPGAVYIVSSDAVISEKITYTAAHYIPEGFYNAVTKKYTVNLYINNIKANTATFGYKYNTEVMTLDSFTHCYTAFGSVDNVNDYVNDTENGIYIDRWMSTETGEIPYIDATEEKQLIGTFVFSMEDYSAFDIETDFTEAVWTDKDGSYKDGHYLAVPHKTDSYDTTRVVIISLPLTETDATEYTVSGNVVTVRESGKAPNAENLAKIQLLFGSKVVAEFTESADSTSGTIAFELKAVSGKYTLRITKHGYIVYENEITVSGDTAIEDIALIAGDIKENTAATVGDGKIDLSDFIRVVRGFDENIGASYRAAVDIDEDNFITVKDLGYIKANFGKNANSYTE